MINKCNFKKGWGVLMTDRMTERQLDICNSGVDFATENLWDGWNFWNPVSDVFF